MPRLRASTLIEAIVAAVIFLIVFAVSMETMSRLTVKDDAGISIIEATYRVKMTFNRFADGKHPAGSYVEEFDWGEITTVVSQYKDYNTLQLIVVGATIKNCNKQMEHREIIEITHE